MFYNVKPTFIKVINDLNSSRIDLLGNTDCIRLRLIVKLCWKYHNAKRTVKILNKCLPFNFSTIQHSWVGINFNVCSFVPNNDFICIVTSFFPPKWKFSDRAHAVGLNLQILDDYRLLVRGREDASPRTKKLNHVCTISIISVEIKHNVTSTNWNTFTNNVAKIVLKNLPIVSFRNYRK